MQKNQHLTNKHNNYGGNGKKTELLPIILYPLNLSLLLNIISVYVRAEQAK